MTHSKLVEQIVREHGPVTDRAIFYLARAKGSDATSESLRTRRNEAVKAGRIQLAGTTVNGRGKVINTWKAV